MSDGGGASDEPAPAASAPSNDGRAGPEVDHEVDDAPISPVYQYASIFLLLTVALQMMTTSFDEAGPIDHVASILIPKLAYWGFKGGGDPDEFGSEDGGSGVCPPDKWVDAAFAEEASKTINGDGAVGGLYSTDHDPRNRINMPPMFPHCALSRWVQRSATEFTCPAGQEFVTVILPPKVKPSRKDKVPEEGKIPKILHISSPTNCIPSSTLRALRKLIHERFTQSYTIYVHSEAAMEDFTFSREWEVFPEVKEGALCGAGKLMAVTRRALKDEKLAPANVTHSERITNEIGTGVRRDIWRLMVLWEYGGVVMDINAIHAIFEGRGRTEPSYDLALPSHNSTENGGYVTMGKLMQEWSSERSADALVYFINNSDKQRLPYMERIPFTEMMGAAPSHPFVYYAAKSMLRIAIKDDEKPITDSGRTTKVKAITEGLAWVGGKGWKSVKTGATMKVSKDTKHSIRLLDGDTILPPSLTSPRTTPWRSIFASFTSVKKADGKAPDEEDVNALMRHFANEQKYIAKKTMFSCMEYTLDMYLHQKTKK